MALNYILHKQLADPRSEKVRARLLRKKQSAPLFDPSIPVTIQRSALDNFGHTVKPVPGQHIKPIMAGRVSAQIPEGQLACDRIGHFLHSMFGQADTVRQAGETIASERSWSWQQDAKQVRCHAIELTVSEQCLIAERRTRKVIA